MAGGSRRTASAAPSAPAVNKIEDWYDSTNKRLRSIDEKGNKVDISGGLDSIKLLINAGFKFAQRQPPATLTAYAATTGRSYAADRWGMTIQTSSLQYARVDTNTTPETGLDARFYGQFKQITGAGKFFISQVVEASRANHMRGHQVRVMCKMKASSAKTIRFGLLQLANAGTVDTIPAAFETAFGADTVDPTFGTNLALITPDLVALGVFGVAPGTQAIRGSAIDCSVTTAWQSFGFVVTLPSNYKNLIPVIFTDAQFSINDILNVSQVTMLNQTGDCDWNEQPDEQDFEACQRYFCKTFPADTNPAQSGGVSGALRDGVAIAAAVATSSVMRWQFPVSMRAAPTVTFFNPSAANAFMRNVPAATDATVTAAANITADACDVNATGLAAWTVGQEIKVHATANAEL